MADLKIEGLEETLAAFKKLGLAGEREGAKAVAATAQKVRTDAIKLIQRGTKTGSVYEDVFATIGGKVFPVGKRGDGNNLSPTHQASAPGEAPATDTGRLVSSIKAVSVGLSGAVFSKLKYSYWLEHGTLDGRIEARPFLAPAMKQNEEYFAQKLAAGINKAAADFNKSGDDFR